MEKLHLCSSSDPKALVPTIEQTEPGLLRGLTALIALIAHYFPAGCQCSDLVRLVRTFF
jgi:hypothetical protein